MNPLASRKKLLIAESELNRAQLVQEWQTMTAEVHSLASQARSVGSFASAAATLVAGLASCRQKKSAPEEKKSSRWQTIAKVAGLVSTFWSEFRARPKT
jgi:HPt (histidine-containing phosphotransfer) domain-containing protein